MTAGGASRRLDEAVLGVLLPAFPGSRPPSWLLKRVRAGTANGVSVFLRANAGDIDRLAALTRSLHEAAPDGLPLLIAADQEGGQLVGLGHETTRFPGAMALGAAEDPALTEAVGLATARELRALGVTVCYAPVCDLAVTPDNVSLGTRAFGSDPDAVARQAAAFTRGLMAGGVVATPKHFPGFGAVSVDPHHALGIIELGEAELLARELVPFRAALAAGAGMAMSGHVALPALTGERDLPATLSRAVMHDLLRGELGFRGVSITDAMDMRALAPGPAQVVDGIVALRAGVDLLLMTPDVAAQRQLEAGLRQAAVRGLLPGGHVLAALRRIARLRSWLARFEWPDREVVRSAAHDDLARRAAAAAVTLVRDDAGLLPLRPRAGDRIAVITPVPRDLTPADSSVTEPLDLASAISRHHEGVLALRVASEPDEADLAAAREAVTVSSLAIVGTLATAVQPAQARLVDVLLATGKPVVTVALRTPYDLADYPQARTHLCTYTILPSALDALADALFGQAVVGGRLPVPIEGLYPRGHGIERAFRAA
ncbi:glycoside hydrolase family 3 protein [soil metagenome]